MRMTNFAQAMGLPSDQRELLYVAAPMHDVGKIGIADAALLKPGKLTDAEFEEQMMAHYGFAGVLRQEEQHHAFEAKLREFYAELHVNPFVAQFDVLS